MNKQRAPAPDRYKRDHNGEGNLFRGIVLGLLFEVPVVIATAIVILILT